MHLWDDTCGDEELVSAATIGDGLIAHSHGLWVGLNPILAALAGGVY